MSTSDGQASAEAQGSPAWAALPPELLRRVSGLLEPEESLAVAQTCHSWCDALAPEEEPAYAAGPSIDCLPQQQLGLVLGMAAEQRRECRPLALVCKRWHGAVWAEPSIWRQLKLTAPFRKIGETDEPYAARQQNWMQGTLRGLQQAGSTVQHLELDNMCSCQLALPAPQQYFAAALQHLPALCSLSLLRHTRGSIDYLLPCTGLTSLSVEGQFKLFGPAAPYLELQLSQLTVLSRLRQLRITDLCSHLLPPHPSAFPALTDFTFRAENIEVCGASMHVVAFQAELWPYWRNSHSTLWLSASGGVPDLRALLSALQPPGQALLSLHVGQVPTSLGELYGCSMLSALTSLRMVCECTSGAPGHFERLDALLEALLEQAAVEELDFTKCARIPTCLARLSSPALRKLDVCNEEAMPDLPHGPYLQGLQHLRLGGALRFYEETFALPLALTAVRSLTQLDLSANSTFEPSAAAMDPVLTRLPLLIHLNLSGCNLNGLPSAEYLTVLSSLDLGRNWLDGMPPALASATNLRRLGLRDMIWADFMRSNPSDNGVAAEEEAVSILASLPLLEEVDLRDNPGCASFAQRLRLARPQLRVLM